MSNKLLEIDQEISCLSLEEQKWLLKRLTQQVNRKITTIIEENNLENKLEIMANDPQIQAEIKLINEEFLVTEMDGIEDL